MSDISEWDAKYRDPEAPARPPADPNPAPTRRSAKKERRIVATVGGRSISVNDPLVSRPALKRRVLTIAVAGLALAGMLLAYRTIRQGAAAIPSPALMHSLAPEQTPAAPSRETLQGEDADVSLEAAVEAVREGNLTAAAVMFAELEETPGEKPVVFYHYYGDVALLLGREELALSNYRAAVSKSKGRSAPDLLNSLAYLLVKRGEDLVAAELYVRDALERDSENSSYLDTLGCLYFKAGDLDRARKILESAAVRSTSANSAEIHEHLGDVCYTMSDITAAQESWRQALASSPKSPRLLRKINAASNGNAELLKD